VSAAREVIAKPQAKNPTGLRHGGPDRGYAGMVEAGREGLRLPRMSEKNAIRMAALRDSRMATFP